MMPKIHQISLLLTKMSAATTAGAAVVSGNVKNIFIDPTEFDIDKVTSIEIFGGNGSGAIARAFLEERFREVFFSGVSTNLGGNTRSFTTIAFSKDHNFSDGEKVIYDSNGGSNLGIGTTGPADATLSLFNGQVYFANVKSPRLSLYTTIKTMLLQVSTALPLMRTLS